MIATTAGTVSCEAQGRARSQSPTASAIRRFRRNRGAVIALVLLVLCVASAVIAPVIAPYDPIKMEPRVRLSAPSYQHWLGTDLYGRDILSRVIYGSRSTLETALFAVTIGLVIGAILGLLAGYYGGAVDEIIMRLMDVMLSFPGILLALSIVAFLGPGQMHLSIAVGIGLVPSFARIARGSSLSEKQKLHVEAARCIGCSSLRVIRIHILPNIIAPLIVVTTLAVAWAVLNAAALNFLGLGTRPPTPDWGMMLSEGRDYLKMAPWVTTFPGLAIMAVVVAVNVLGDGLRVALDPHMKV